MQRFGGRLRDVFAYEGRTARAKFLSQPRMGWYIYSKKNYLALLTQSLAILCDSTLN